MKKKLSLYIYLIFTSCFNSIAQTYTPFPTADAVWTNRYYFLAQDLPQTKGYNIELNNEDTLINN